MRGKSKEMQRFLGEVVKTPEMAEEMDALKQEYAGRLALLAGKYGFNLTPEDFTGSISPLEDDRLEEVSGGWNPLGPFFSILMLNLSVGNQEGAQHERNHFSQKEPGAPCLSRQTG